MRRNKQIARRAITGIAPVPSGAYMSVGINCPGGAELQTIKTTNVWEQTNSPKGYNWNSPGPIRGISVRRDKLPRRGRTYSLLICSKKVKNIHQNLSYQMCFQNILTLYLSFDTWKRNFSFN
jgi:hypothetical protein